MKTVLAVIMVVVALVLAIAPIFTDCESQGKTLKTAEGKAVSMKCHWTGIAEIAPAIFLGLAGILALASRRKEGTRFAAIIGVVAGAVAILLPTKLIGTCGMDTMVCNTTMKPILLAAGILAIVASTAMFFFGRDAEPTTPKAAA